MAGLAFMHTASVPEFYLKLRKLERQFHDGINKIIEDNDINMIVPNYGARFNILLGRRTPASNYEETFCHNKQVFLNILKDCFDRGVYFHDYGGGPAHHGYSVQHTEEDMECVLEVLKCAVLKNMK